MEIILTIEELQRLLGTRQYESNISLPYQGQWSNYDPCYMCPNRQEGRICDCILGTPKIMC